MHFLDENLAIGLMGWVEGASNCAVPYDSAIATRPTLTSCWRQTKRYEAAISSATTYYSGTLIVCMVMPLLGQLPTSKIDQISAWHWKRQVQSSSGFC